MKRKYILSSLSLTLLIPIFHSEEVMSLDKQNFIMDRFEKESMLSDSSMSQMAPQHRKKNIVYTMDRFEKESMLSDSSMSQMPLQQKTKPLSVIREKRQEPINETDDMMAESVSTLEVEAFQARLIDDPDLMQHIKRLYLNVTFKNYEDLWQNAQNFIKKGLFKRFDGGVWIQCDEKSQFDQKKLLQLVRPMHKVTKYRISFNKNKAYSGENAVDIIAETICGFKDLKEIDLSDCSLNNDQLKKVLKVISSSHVVELILTGNSLTDEILPIIQHKFNGLQELQSDFLTIGIESDMRTMKISDQPSREEALAKKAQELKAEQERLRQIEAENARKAEEARQKVKAEQEALEKQRAELAEQRRVLEEQQRQVVARPVATSVPAFARGHEEIYHRFINGKLIFDNKEGQRKEFLFRQFADTCEGEFDLSGLQYRYNGELYNVNNYLSINLGFRRGKNPAHADKVEVWILPKFLMGMHIDGAANHYECTVWDKWTGEVGILWTYGNWSSTYGDCNYFAYKSIEYINTKDLDVLWDSSERSGWNILKDLMNRRGSAGHVYGMFRSILIKF